MEAQRVLGVVGTSPTGVRGPVRAGDFRSFQRLVGELASPGWFAGHAACHALMNDVGRVVFAGVDDPAEGDVTDVVAGLLEAEVLSALVVPGLVAVEPMGRLAELWSDRGPGGCLWIDPPRGASPSEILAHRRAVGGDPERVRVATPWIPTITPGLRGPTALPPSCLVAPLHLGTTARLRGVHDPPAPPGPDDEERLREAGCGLLVPFGRRRRVTLAFPAPRPSSGSGEAEEDPISRALREAAERLAHEQPNGPALWKSLERSARSILSDFQRRGAITEFHVRCDEETNLDAGPDPVLEVRLRRPRLVHEVILRVGQA